jgi:membrane protein required for colicin V production
MANLNWVDYVLLIILFYSIVMGLIRGLVYEVIALITWIAAVVIACLFSEALSHFFTSFSQVETVVNSTTNASGVDTSQPISYIAIGISFLILFSVTLLIGRLVNAVFSSMAALSIGNRILGAFFGLFRGLIINLVVIFLLQLTPVGAQLWWSQSQIVTAYQPAVRWLEGVISPSLAELQGSLWEKLQTLQTEAQDAASKVTEKVTE